MNRAIRHGAPWQARRSRFNHDWLKNIYLPRLATYLNLVTGKFRDPELVASFRTDVLDEWRAHEVEARDLVKTFAVEMSPSVVLSECPDTHRWVGQVADVLWRQRLGIPTVLERAERKLANAAKAFAKLEAACPGGELPASTSGRPALAGALAQFRTSCQELGDAFAAFPQSIRVV